MAKPTVCDACEKPVDKPVRSTVATLKLSNGREERIVFVMTASREFCTDCLNNAEWEYES